jgi:TnpA family transposase
LYRLGSLKAYPQLKKVIQRTIKQSRIVEQWDEILRVVVSLKLGWVSASLLVSKLQSYPRQNALMLILREYGRLCKTIFSLRYLIEESYRRQIEIQLNKGEHLHALRDQFFIGFGRQLRKHTMTTQTNQASSTNLIVNCIVVWNTLYMQKAVEQLRSEGFEVRDEELSHIWPSRYQHVNVFGRYTFPMEDILARKDLRDLRQPTTTELEEEGEPLAG